MRIVLSVGKLLLKFVLGANKTCFISPFTVLVNMINYSEPGLDQFPNGKIYSEYVSHKII